MNLTNNHLFFDGAFGTYYNKITRKNTSCEFANLDDKETVQRIHQEYIIAGVNAIKTNTFGANFTLSFNEEQIREIIEQGFQIATKITENTDVAVFADIGYISAESDNTEEYIRIADVFIACGAKNFIFETLADIEEILPATQYIRKNVVNATIVVSFAVSQDGYTSKGHYYKDLIKKATENKVDIVGLNCICGPSHMVDLAKKLDLSHIKFLAMPNSGYPTLINGRIVFIDNPEYFAGKLLDIYSLGVYGVGGCCGTTPNHIKSSIEKIKNIHIDNLKEKATPIKTAQPILNSSGLQRKLENNQKLIAVELDPPLDTNVNFLMEASRTLKAAQVDVITLADSPLSRTRADSIIIASKIKREIGIDVLPHLTCRDKNHIAIKASLIGANIENISDILVITGDPLVQTDRTEHKGVFSFNSFNLMSYISSLNEEIFYSSPFYIAGALNVNSSNFEVELKRAQQKINNGAKLLLTQPLFSESSISNFILAKKTLGCKILAGILPIASYKNAMFLNNEVCGIEIPEDIILALQGKSTDEAKEISLSFCKRIIEKVHPYCDGYYLITPLKKIDFVSEIVKYIRST